MKLLKNHYTMITVMYTLALLPFVLFGSGCTASVTDPRATLLPGSQEQSDSLGNGWFLFTVKDKSGGSHTILMRDSSDSSHTSLILELQDKPQAPISTGPKMTVVDGTNSQVPR